MRKRFVVSGLAAAALVSSLIAAPATARAQAATGNVSPIGSFPQAMVGLGLVGAEAVILVEGAVGLRNPWILLGTGALGLIGGGIGGYFVDQAIDASIRGGNTNLGLASSGMLVLGLGLIIPTAIMFVSATMYHPADDNRAPAGDTTSGAPPSDEESVTPAQGSTGSSTSPSGSAPPAPANSPKSRDVRGAGGRSTLHRLGPEAVLNVTSGHFRLGIPAVAMVPSYSLEEMRQFGLHAQSEWRVPVITAAF